MLYKFTAARLENINVPACNKLGPMWICYYWKETSSDFLHIPHSCLFAIALTSNRYRHWCGAIGWCQQQRRVPMSGKCKYHQVLRIFGLDTCKSLPVWRDTSCNAVRLQLKAFLAAASGARLDRCGGREALKDGWLIPWALFWGPEIGFSDVLSSSHVKLAFVHSVRWNSFST